MMSHQDGYFHSLAGLDLSFMHDKPKAKAGDDGSQPGNKPSDKKSNAVKQQAREPAVHQKGHAIGKPQAQQQGERAEYPVRLI